MIKANGYIIYKGASLLDGKPIIAVAQIGKSHNKKTGAMIQTQIIRSDIDPISASKTGEDFSICGNCPHRGIAHNDPKKKTAKNRSCYVTLMHAPLTTYKQFKKNAYPLLNGHDDIAEIARDRKVRIGTYGDPSAIPSYIWKSLLSLASGHTAYSHQANFKNADFRSDLFMHSVETLDDAIIAWGNGDRTFRVLKDIKELNKDKEILCPASEEAGKKTSCIKCGLCAGTTTKSKKSIAIVAHGNGSKYVKELA